jgi:hypothetical protein
MHNEISDLRWMMRSKFALLIVFSLLLAGIAYPAAAQTEVRVYATAQRFENGLMIWRSDTGFIWALANNGQAYTYPAHTYSRFPDNPIFGDPSSRLRPIFGFGKVWGSSLSLRQLIGWPALPEIGFDMTIRQSGGSTYLTQLDGTVYQVNANGTWNFAVSPPPTTPYILSFTASPNPVVPGGQVTLNWTAQGTEFVVIHMYDLRQNSTGGQNLLEIRERLPLTGSTTITVPPGAAAGVRFTIWGVNQAHFTSSMSMWEWVVQSSITLNTTANSAGTVTTQAAFQQYENGFLIWRADLGTIYAFYGSSGGTFGGWLQRDYEFLLDNPITDVPVGRVRPINGFGRVWGNFESVRTMLGWATGAEQSYQLRIQTSADSAVYDYSLPDGRVVHTRREFWSF